jgi:hypothetical protein
VATIIRFGKFLSKRDIVNCRGTRSLGVCAEFGCKLTTCF